MGRARENQDYYVVKEGDTLESIADRFLGVGLAPLLTQLNGVDENTIKPGMRLWLHPEYDD
jgi:FOG: LysM repeat